jgi:hypothetical protein
MREVGLDLQPKDPDRDDWKQGFDDSSMSGLACLTCGALVMRRGDMTQLHRDWHEQHGR